MSEDLHEKENKANNEENITHYAFDDKRHNHDSLVNSSTINKGHNDTLVVSQNTMLYVILGWISAALTIFISPLFAIAGIAFGVLLNRKIRGSGNTLIIANVVLGIINILLGIMVVILSEQIIGY